MIRGASHAPAHPRNRNATTYCTCARTASFPLAYNQLLELIPPSPHFDHIGRTTVISTRCARVGIATSTWHPLYLHRVSAQHPHAPSLATMEHDVRTSIVGSSQDVVCGEAHREGTSRRASTLTSTAQNRPQMSEGLRYPPFRGWDARSSVCWCTIAEDLRTWILDDTEDHWVPSVDAEVTSDIMTEDVYAA